MKLHSSALNVRWEFSERGNGSGEENNILLVLGLLEEALLAGELESTYVIVGWPPRHLDA